MKNLGLTITLCAMALVSSQLALADTIYCHCESSFDAPAHIISTCFKASSILPDDAQNAAEGFCTEAWSQSVGLPPGYGHPYYHSRSDCFNPDTLSGNAHTEESCEARRKAILDEWKSNYGEPTLVEVSAHPVLNLTSGGIVPSKVSALWLRSFKVEFQK